MRLWCRGFLPPPGALFYRMQIDSKCMPIPNVHDTMRGKSCTQKMYPLISKQVKCPSLRLARLLLSMEKCIPGTAGTSARRIKSRGSTMSELTLSRPSRVPWRMLLLLLLVAVAVASFVVFPVKDWLQYALESSADYRQRFPAEHQHRQRYGWRGPAAIFVYQPGRHATEPGRRHHYGGRLFHSYDFYRPIGRWQQ